MSRNLRKRFFFKGGGGGRCAGGGILNKEIEIDNNLKKEFEFHNILNRMVNFTINLLDHLNLYFFLVNDLSPLNSSVSESDRLLVGKVLGILDTVNRPLMRKLMCAHYYLNYFFLSKIWKRLPFVTKI